MKQKIFVLFIVFIFLVVPLTAEKIDLPTAEKAGMIHLEQQQHIWLSQLNQGLLQKKVNNFSIADVSPVIDETSGDTLFYVFHLIPEGFIVVSGDTVIQPVIAYSYYCGFSPADISNNFLLQMLKTDIKERLSAAPSAVNNREWEILPAGIASEPDYHKNVEQWPPVGHSQYNKGWLKTGVIAAALEQIVSYWKFPGPVKASADTMDISRELKETWQYNSAKRERYLDSTSFFTSLIDNMRKGWPVQLAIQIENSDEVHFVICDGYRKTGSGVEYFHLKVGGEWGTWYALKDSGHFIKYGVMDIHPTADLHEPNNNRHDAFPILERDFVGNNGVWDSSAGTKIKASIERDWYRFEAKAGEKVTISFRGNWKEAGEIVLYHNDILLKQQEIIGNGEKESLSHRVDTTGTYYIAVGNNRDKLVDGDISREAPEEPVTIVEKPYGISIAKVIGDSDPPNLLTVELKYPIQYVVYENTYADYRAEAYFDDDTLADVTNVATWSENSVYTWFSSSIKGRMYAGNVPSDQTVNITVSYTYNGRTRYAYQTVTVKPTPTLSSITIIGDFLIPECTSRAYHIKAYFTDGTYTTPSSGVNWSENSDYAEISSNGVLTAYAVCCNKTVIITATYSTGGVTKSAAKTVIILD